MNFNLSSNLRNFTTVKSEIIVQRGLIPGLFTINIKDKNINASNTNKL